MCVTTSRDSKIIKRRASERDEKRNSDDAALIITVRAGYGHDGGSLSELREQHYNTE